MKSKKSLYLLLCALVLLGVLTVYEAYFQPSAILYPVYELDMTLETGSGFDDVPVYLTETARISFTNTSDTAWNEVCLRDYSYFCIAESTWIPDPQYNADGQLEAVYSAPTEYIHEGIQAVTDKKGQALAFQSKAEDPSVVYVTLAKPLAPGQRTTITVSYQTVVPYGGERLSWHETVYDDPTGRTISLSQAYPMLAEYLDDGWNEAPYVPLGECFLTPCGSYQVTLRLSKDYTVVSTGQEQQNEDGTWSLTGENVRDFVIIASNDFEVCTAQSQGVTINSYYYANSEPARNMGQESLQAAVDAVAAFTAQWGEYPYEELDVVETHFNHGGMEYPGLVRIADIHGAFLADFGDLETLQLSVAHETGHQWFYGVVGNDQYRQAWLDEAFASFSEYIYLEYLGAEEAAIADRVTADNQELPQRYIDLPYDGYVDLSLGADADTTDYIQAMYRTGRVFLWKLRQAMGKDAFDAFMRSWYGDNQFAIVTTEQFISELTQSAGENPQVLALLEQYLSEYQK